jgi:hypothetical protein
MEFVRALIDCEPDSALAPFQPSDALHEDAFDDDQVNVVLPFLFTTVGLALKLNVGGEPGPGPGPGGGLVLPGETDWSPLLTPPPQAAKARSATIPGTARLPRTLDMEVALISVLGLPFISILRPARAI